MYKCWWWGWGRLLESDAVSDPTPGVKCPNNASPPFSTIINMPSIKRNANKIFHTLLRNCQQKL